MRIFFGHRNLKKKKNSFFRKNKTVFFLNIDEGFFGSFFAKRIDRERNFAKTRTKANLRVLAVKIRIFRQKLVILCATRAGPKVRVLAFKISVLR